MAEAIITTIQSTNQTIDGLFICPNCDSTHNVYTQLYDSNDNVSVTHLECLDCDMTSNI